MVNHLVCLLEEESAKILLESLMPRLFPKSEVSIHFQTFQGKQDLEKNLERRIRVWLAPDTVFLIMRDQDSGDCKRIKTQLLDIIKKTGKEDDCLVRIACHELESFYLGDLDAVAEAFGAPSLKKLKKKSKFREPDQLSNACEEFKKLLPAAESKSKVNWARKMAYHLSTEGSSSSGSYRALVTGLRRLLAD